MSSSAYAAGYGQPEEEVFYSTYEPTPEEITEYAMKIGIDPDKEANLVYLARQGLLHPLPEHWKPCYSKQVKAYYYYDRISKKSQWEHPIDVLYRAKVADARKATSLDRSDSASLGDSGFRSLKSAHDKCDTSVVGPSSKSSNLAGSNEPPKVDDSAAIKQGVQVQSLGPTQSAPHNEEVDDDESDSNKENNSQEAIASGAIGGTVGDIRSDGGDVMALSTKLSFNVGASVRDRAADGTAGLPQILGSKFGRIQGFTLSGTGSQFLKSNKKPEFGSLELVNRKSESEVKGILRDSSLTYMRNKTTPNEDSGSDERKSVRFDIELKTTMIETVPDDSLIYFDEVEEVGDNELAGKGPKEDGEGDGDDDDDDGDDDDNEEDDDEGGSDNDVCRNIETEHNADAGEGDHITGSIQSTAPDEAIVGEQEEELGGIVKQLKQTIERERAQYQANLEEELNSLATLEKANIQNELSKERRRYDELLVQEKQHLAQQHQDNLEEIKEFYQAKLNEMKKDKEEDTSKEYEAYRVTLQEEFDRKVKAVTEEHRATMATLQKNHDEIVEELERDLKMEEELLKKEQGRSLTEMKIKLNHELEVERQRMRETGEDRLYEKVRCEKRLLEDKYKCLKEKYTRLKTDVRISLERRKKRREQQQQQSPSQLPHQHNHQHSLLSNSYETDDRTTSKPLPPSYPPYGKPASSSGMLASEISSISMPSPSAAYKRFPHKGSAGHAEVNKSNKMLCFTAGGESQKALKLVHHNMNGTNHNGNNINNNVSYSNNNHTNNNNNNVNNNNHKNRGTTNNNTDATSQSETTQSKSYFQLRNIFASVQREDNFSSDSEFDRNHTAMAVADCSSTTSQSVVPVSRQKRKIFTKTKSASTSKLNSTRHERDARPCTPVENLRIQLKKLEELEDQIPECNIDAPYHLRYPFISEHVGNHVDTNGGAAGSPKGQGVGYGSSSEMEFFKHRILLERDSVQRAKESLRTQKNVFKSKQHDISMKYTMQTSHAIEQIFGEEKELIEMEVSLHRTRALLGEKVIRLRHLERSLQKLAEKDVGPANRAEQLDRTPKPKETLSDLSSYSNSGFSSTDLPFTEHCSRVIRTMDLPKDARQNEALLYLEHLHSEIQEIWCLLNPAIASPDSKFDMMNFVNITNKHSTTETVLPLKSVAPAGVIGPPGGQQTVADHEQPHQYTANLLDKIRDLKNWLRQAKNENEIINKQSFD
ncbi:centrosomal protein of 164 kDa [Anopheles bellator]|uniref:centrosomal protein of 164 kDa n=1 Tax=Anopheles bellator TaxID=139047 RepID=UPI0026491D16|nr:centrosomal protein of 164 kDa [Anopheles bellator]